MHSVMVELRRVVASRFSHPNATLLCDSIPIEQLAQLDSFLRPDWTWFHSTLEFLRLSQRKGLAARRPRFAIITAHCATRAADWVGRPSSRERHSREQQRPRSLCCSEWEIFQRIIITWWWECSSLIRSRELTEQVGFSSLIERLATDGEKNKTRQLQLAARAARDTGVLDGWRAGGQFALH